MNKRKLNTYYIDSTFFPWVLAESTTTLQSLHTLFAIQLRVLCTGLFWITSKKRSEFVLLASFCQLHLASTKNIKQQLTINRHIEVDVETVLALVGEHGQQPLQLTDACARVKQQRVIAWRCGGRHLRARRPRRVRQPRRAPLRRRHRRHVSELHGDGSSAHINSRVFLMRVRRNYEHLLRSLHTLFVSFIHLVLQKGQLSNIRNRRACITKCMNAVEMNTLVENTMNNVIRCMSWRSPWLKKWSQVSREVTWLEQKALF